MTGVAFTPTQTVTTSADVFIPQTITFTAPTSPYSFAANQTDTMNASGGGSGNAVTFSVDDSSTGTGTFNGNVLTITHSGFFVIDANQAGNSEY